MREIIFYLCDLQKHDDLPDEFEFELSESSRVRQQTDPGYLRDDILINSANIFGLDVAEKICDKIAIIKDGKLVVQGDMNEVKGDTSLENIFLELEGQGDFKVGDNNA